MEGKFILFAKSQTSGSRSRCWRNGNSNVLASSLGHQFKKEGFEMGRPSLIGTPGRAGPRLIGEPGSPEFIAYYTQAVSQKLAPPVGVMYVRVLSRATRLQPSSPTSLLRTQSGLHPPNSTLIEKGHSAIFHSGALERSAVCRGVIYGMARQTRSAFASASRLCMGCFGTCAFMVSQSWPRRRKSV